MASRRGMHVSLDWLRPEIHCHAQAASVYHDLLLWRLHKSQGMLSAHCGVPPAEGNGHRPRGMVIGHWWMAGRHWIWPAGKSFLQNLFWQQQRAKQGMAMHFKQMCAPTHPLSCLWLKGTWFSILGPPTAHFNAWWSKKSSMHFNVNECNKTHECYTPCHVKMKDIDDRRLRRVTSLWVRTPLISLAWFDTPNQVNAMHVMQTWLKDTTWY